MTPMMSELPPSLARRAVGRQHEREQRVLHNYKRMCAVRMGIVWNHPGDPDRVTWIDAAAEQGYSTNDLGTDGMDVTGFYKGKDLVFIAIETPTGAIVAPAAE